MANPEDYRSANPPSSLESAPASLFGAAPPEAPDRGRFIAVAIIGALVAIGVAVFFLRQSENKETAIARETIRQADPYARNLAFTQVAMSQSTSLSGGTSTYIDGHVRNSGPDTVTGVTMQVLFRNDVALPPQVETLSLTLIRTHDPYIDTEPVGAAPLKSGDEAEFRLIVENVTGSWNQQLPDLIAVHVDHRP